MDDKDVMGHINELVEEEKRLRDTPDHDVERLAAIERQLDQAWDLLRRRRAREEYGQDPDDEGGERSAAEVETYLQ